MFAPTLIKKILAIERDFDRFEVFEPLQKPPAFAIPKSKLPSTAPVDKVRSYESGMSNDELARRFFDVTIKTTAIPAIRIRVSPRFLMFSDFPSSLLIR